LPPRRLGIGLLLRRIVLHYGFVKNFRLHLAKNDTPDHHEVGGFMETGNPMLDLAWRTGPLAVPLALCSVLALAIILERSWLVFRTPRPRKEAVDDLLAAARAGRWAELGDALPHLPGPLADGFRLLSDNRDMPRLLRDEIASLWLEDLRRRLSANLRLLQLLSALAPLLGLTGTVLGMIVSFHDIAHSDRPVNPALVADGLWQAMLTTAFGLFIAIPALLAAQAFRMWVGKRIGETGSALDRFSLAIETQTHDRQAKS
jgi:biopolymer transport protein ExbB